MHEVTGFEAIVALFDSTITFHARYQQRRDVATLIDLLVLDGDNPHLLAWVVQTLRGRITRLPGSAPSKLTTPSHKLPDPAGCSKHWPRPARPVETAQHLAHLRPCTTASQRLVSHALTITPTPAQCREIPDLYGNTRAFFALESTHHSLPQSALNSKTPMQAMKTWYASHPHLFRKRPYDWPECDI